MSKDPMIGTPPPQTNRNREKTSGKITRLQRFAIIISVIIAAIVIVFNITNIVKPYFGTFSTNAILIAIALGILVWAFWLPSRKTASKVLNYYLTILPMIFALTLIYLVNELQQIPELRAKIDPLFSVGLWFVVISSLTSLTAIINTDQRIDKLEKRLFPEKNVTPPTTTLDDDKHSSSHKNKLERASQIATIVSAIALIVIAGVTLYYVHQQGNILEKQFRIENSPYHIASLMVGNIDLQNLNYDEQPLTEKISVSISSTHLLRIYVTNINFSSPYGPYGNFTKKPEIFMRQIEEDIGPGVTNINFEIPFQLTFDVNKLAPYPQNTTWVGIPITTQLKVIDSQIDNDIGHVYTLNSTFGINGEYVPKK